MKRIAIALLAILLSCLLLGQVHAQGKKETRTAGPMHSASSSPSSSQNMKEPLGPDRWPTTVKATVADILSTLSEKDKQALRKIKKDELIKFHHGWGTGIRNYYGLWRGNSALREDACGKRCHLDDASMVIITAVWEAVQREASSEGPDSN